MIRRIKECKNKLDKIGFGIILITIVLLNIFIGSNIKQPIWIIQLLVSLFTLLYLITKKIQKNQHLIIKGKIDIFVLLLMLSTIIPLICKAYVTLEGTCNFILKYWSVYGLYILVRNIVTDSKKVKIIINTTIISSIIPIIFGFDKLTFNIFEPFLHYINAVKIEDTRMISTFGYANTFAAYLSLTVSISIAQFLNTEKKKNKILYALYILVASITILLTQSKMVLAEIVLVIFILLGIVIKRKKNRRKWIILIIASIILFLGYVFIAMQIDKPLQIQGKEKTCVIRGIEANTKYEFALDIDAKTDKNYNTFEIAIVEITRYFSENVLERFQFASYNEIKVMNIETNDDVDHIEIRIKNQLQEELTINELKINKEKYILEYKYILDEIVRVFTTFNFKNSSVWQRADYWSDGLKIVQNNNWLIGSGGNTWRVSYGQVQDYLYYAKEGHSYPLELWMSFGILGIISYGAILVISAKNGINLLKNSKKDTKNYKNILAIIIGIGIIIVHSMMDFDLSYLIMLMIVYIFLAIINQEDKKIAKNIKGTSIIILLFTIISVGNIFGFSAEMLDDNTGMTSSKVANWVSKHQYNKISYIEDNNIQDENEIDYIKNYIAHEPYQYQNNMYEIMTNKILCNPQIEDIDYIINTWKTIKMERKYELIEIQKRAEIMLEFSKGLIKKADESGNIELKDKAKEILEILKEEYNPNAKRILDYRKNGEIESITKYKYGYYKNVYKEAVKILENAR